MAFVVPCLLVCALPSFAHAGTPTSPTRPPATVSFESPSAGRSAPAGTLRRIVRRDAPHGRRVGRVERRSGRGPVVLRVRARLRGKPGRRYVATALVRAANRRAVGRPVRIILRQRAARGRVVRSWSSPRTRLRGRFTALAVAGRPTARGRLEVLVVAAGSRAGMAVLVDAVTVRRQEGRARVRLRGAAADGSFEGGTEGWIAENGRLAVVTDTAAPDGRRAVEVSRRTGRWYGLREAPPTRRTTQGGPIRAEVWLRSASASATGDPVSVSIVQRDGSGRVISTTAAPASALAGAWTRTSVEAVGASTGGTAEVRVIQGEAGRRDAFLADAVTLSVAPPEGATTPEPAPAEPAPPPAPAPPPPATAPAFDAGILSNGSFEGSTDGWIGYGATVGSQQAGDAPHGAAVMRVVNSGSLGYFTANASPSVGPTPAGATYTAHAWVRSAGPSSVGGSVQIKLRERSPSGSVVADTASAPRTLSSQWQAVTVTSATTASGNAMDLRVSHVGSSAGAAFDLDAVRLTATDAPAAQPPPAEPPPAEPPPAEPPPAEPPPAEPPSAPAPPPSDGGSGGDATGPTLTVTSPTEGQTLSGTTAVAASASDPSGVARVEFRLDGQLVSTRTTAPYTWSWDTTGWSNGSHTIHVTAVDTVGNASGAGRSVTVSNAVAAPPPAAQASAEERPFDPGHPVYQPIPENPRLYEHSAAIVSHIASSKAGFSFDTGSESAPIYVGRPSDPVWTVNGSYTVHAPADITAGSGSDYPLIVLDQANADFTSSGVQPTEFRMWQATINRSARTISANGIGVGSYRNDGQVLSNVSLQGSSKVRRALGQAEMSGQNTGSGNSYTVGMIRPIDVRRGRIDHAIRVAIGYPHSQRFFWPATRTENQGYAAATNANAPMGARIFLDPGVDVEALGDRVAARLGDAKNKAFARMFVRALQEYGMIALDGTTGNHTVYLEGDLTAGWSGLIGPKNAYGSYNDISRAVAEELPWSSLRVADPSQFDGFARTPLG